MVVRLRALLVGTTFALALCTLPANAGHKHSFAHGAAFVPVLLYHHVKYLKPSDNAIERGLTVLPDEFDAQLRYLAYSHYHTLRASQLVHDLARHRKLPSRAVVLTFDDGYVDAYDTVYPMLRRRHMTATFFIVPGFLGKSRYMTWFQVEEMASHGMDIESHTMTHPDLALLTAKQVRSQLVDSREDLKHHLRRSIRVFAYPYGSFDRLVTEAVAYSGYEGAFTTQEGWPRGTSHLLTLPRIHVDLDDTVPIFANRLSGDQALLGQDAL